jgi:hypothetical protein
VLHGFQLVCTPHLPSTFFRCRQSISLTREKALCERKSVCGNLSIFRHFGSKPIQSFNNENPSNFLGGWRVRTTCFGSTRRSRTRARRKKDEDEDLVRDRRRPCVRQIHPQLCVRCVYETYSNALSAKKTYKSDLAMSSKSNSKRLLISFHINRNRDFDKKNSSNVLWKCSTTFSCHECICMYELDKTYDLYIHKYINA